MKIINTDKAPAAIGPYSQAVTSGGFVYTSGQIAINPVSGNVESDTIEAQTLQVCKNIKALLDSSGSGIDKVVKTTCFLRNMEDFAAFNSVYEKYFVSKPARSCVAVRDLPKNVLVEIDTVAEVQDNGCN
ncbi:MAG: RidA family protein [Clostridia bacterium]|nr:RidA family protein [Clostridia bacterium]